MKDNFDDKRFWIGVDLDGTLAFALETFEPAVIGPPIAKMVDKVKGWLKDGRRVKIFTARVCETGDSSEVGTADSLFAEAQHMLIAEWCKIHLGVELEVTSLKDFRCEAFYDDRAWRVEKNTGEVVGVEVFRYEFNFPYRILGDKGSPKGDQSHDFTLTNDTKPE